MGTVDFKPLKYITSTSISSVDTDDNGNTIYMKPAKLHGKNTVLRIVVRSDKDVLKARNPKYDLLVP